VALSGMPISTCAAGGQQQHLVCPNPHGMHVLRSAVEACQARGHVGTFGCNFEWPTTWRPTVLLTVWPEDQAQSLAFEYATCIAYACLGMEPSCHLPAQPVAAQFNCDKA